MTNKKHLVTTLSVLALLVVVTSVFVVVFTYAGGPERPDATATYTRNKLTWDIPVGFDGVADLSLFGEPEEGEELPLIHPLSRDTYYLRLKNGVNGAVGYSVYVYTENPHDIPLVFEVDYTDKLRPLSSVPTEIADKQVLVKCGGILSGKAMKDIGIRWYWDSETDEIDTAYGNQAVNEDLKYSIHVLIIVEDNNSYNIHDKPTTTETAGTSTARLLHRKYVRGYPEGDFRQEGAITRAEVAAIFARILANYDEDALTKTSTDFSDVEKNAWYAKYVARLENETIVNGYPDGTFRPDGPITRAEFATVCVRFFESRAGEIEEDDADFTDVENSHWAKTYIDEAAKQGFVTGYPDNSFRPDADITRAEAVTVVNRMLSRYPDKEYIDNNQDSLVQFWDLNDNTYWAYYEIYEAANEHHAKVEKTTETWQSGFVEQEEK